MSNRRPCSTITTGKPGRPKSIRRKAAGLIGSAGLAALESADLHIVPGSILRELAIITGEAAPLSIPNDTDQQRRAPGNQP